MVFFMDIDESRRGENPFDEPVRKLRESDPGEVARKAGGRWTPGDGGGDLALPVLTAEVNVSFPEVSIIAPGAVGSFSLKLLSLLYLAGTDGTPPAGEWVAYRDLPGGRFYEPVVKRSVEDPVAARFGADEPGFLEACKAAGGVRESFGDASCSFELFPNVLVLFILWRADEEFPARVQVLFDSSSTHHLNAFDLRMGSAEIASKLLKWSKEEGG